jgi:hypothetical protein
MKALFLIAIAALLLATLVFSQTASGRKQETAFYCNRSAIKPEQRARKAELDITLLAAETNVRELKHGFEFEFPASPGTFQAAAEWATLERECCPFFDITLGMEREGGPFWLRLTGREGVKQFIAAEFSQLQNHHNKSAVSGEKQ